MSLQGESIMDICELIKLRAPSQIGVQSAGLDGNGR